MTVRIVRSSWLPVALLLAGLLSLSACHSRPKPVTTGSVYVMKDPPVRPTVQRPTRPTGGAVWVSGQWRWNGYRYVWLPGYWELNPRGSWTSGHWRATPHGWVWVYGYWN